MDGVNDVVNNGMGDALSSILSNPELMSKISAIASPDGAAFPGG